MVSKDFDNLLKSIQGASLYVGTTIVSLEIDFDIPKGFIVKIHEVRLFVTLIQEDIEGVAIDKDIRYSLAIILDPDDTTTIGHTSNRIQHDVLLDHIVEVHQVAGSAGDGGTVISARSERKRFVDSGADKISARNMRFNIRGEGTDAADATEAIGIVTVDYTLEEVKDQDILQILDIL